MTAIRSLLILLLWGFSLSAAPLQVLCSLPPHAEAIQAIGGEEIRLMVILPPNASPESFSPSTRQMSSISQGKILFGAGVPFEKNLFPKLQRSCPALKIIPGPNAKDEDAHQWLAPAHLAVFADQVAAALSQALPQKATLFCQRASQYKEKMALLTQELQAILTPLRGKEIPVYHPAYGALLGLVQARQLPLEIEGKTPSVQQMKSLQQQIRVNSSPALFTPPQHDSRSARNAAKQLRKKLVLANPLPEKYTEEMRELAQLFVKESQP